MSHAARPDPPATEEAGSYLARQALATVLRNVPLARDTWLIRLGAPEVAATILPGQFVMIRPDRGTDPLLGRPFALYDVVTEGGRPSAIDIVYQVVGKGTSWLSTCREGDGVSVWGPLGNGFGKAPDGHVLLVAGGIGQTPFLSLGRWWLGQARYGRSPADPGRVASATLLYGVRTADLLAGVEDFRRAGMTVEIATDDGSAGHHGFVTDLLAARLSRGDRPGLVIGCGPPPMLAAVARIASEAAVECLLSLENHMACGFGACFSCVAPILQDDGSTDLRRVCVEGPIFEARRVVWD